MENSQGRDILTVTTTVGSRDDAQKLARAIMQARLAACVQVEEGLTSFYRWQGKECEDAELRLTVKTLPGCEAALQALFREQHPYELPQFVAVRMQAGEGYFAWVRGEVAVPEDPRETLGL
ncbi:divalent-cation tolerance protein CutA [Ramlibacter alkalitolerans]|jgi:periplasmic divalent cation tolerance protein|uniref:Divalent-cation tolerance protein CutA n=1 Tax=Ramlibacter alkalitolerans TaxID=2039631 RepID=A0ABS1JSZ8_9BURK|nr:divalent-cation tolerance protein CutA [Ramlibacter alkalitolerans]MBL0426690.1 divalent-cation tolerance protein CutA [Ramlibacter alkalitolerans]